jgi:hypothetical protein
VGSLGLFSFKCPERLLLTYIDNWTLLLATSANLEEAHSTSREIFASNAYLSPDFICQR